jgi:hypothetical protein
MSSASPSQTLSAEIDSLFLQYLDVLDQYDSLRKGLGNLQVSIQQNIARANFDAPRGVRYGEELYDGRMRAVRFCRVTGTAQPEVFEVVAGARVDSKEDGKEEQDTPDVTSEKADTEIEDEDIKEQTTAQDNKIETKDPLRMFGILTPQALRVAQSESIKMVEDVIPRLVSVDAEMKELEIKIRRARKYRAKSEATETAQATKKMKKMEIKDGIEV